MKKKLNKNLKDLANSGGLDFLMIATHGKPSALIFKDDYFKKKDLSSIPKNLMRKGGLIWIVGCNAGAGNHSIAQEFSNYFNVDVEGSTLAMAAFKWYVREGKAGWKWAYPGDSSYKIKYFPVVESGKRKGFPRADQWIRFHPNE